MTLEWRSTGNLRRPWESECGQFAVNVTCGGASGPCYVASWSPVLGGLYYVGEPRKNVNDALEDCERHDKKIREAA